MVYDVGYGGVLLSTPLHAFLSVTPFAKCTCTKTPWSESASELYRPSDSREAIANLCG
jgi:hypothetical protein